MTTRTSDAALIVCCLFFVGHLAAASKTFGGGGGYGEEAGTAQQQGEAAVQQLVDSTAPKDESYGTLTPTSTEPATPAAEATTETTQPEASSSGEASSSASPATAQEGGYGDQQQSSDEPLNGLNEKAINDIINEHNVFRAKEHVPPLKWNTTLAKFSQDYAETLKKDCKMVHSTSPYGENLMLGSGAISWKTTVDEWSAEKKSYNYGANTCQPGKMCGHYTAVVWKNTTSLGCGRVLCDNKETMIVCSYWPPGNYEDQRPY